jgi:hypothetical protein
MGCLLWVLYPQSLWQMYVMQAINAADYAGLVLLVVALGSHFALVRLQFIVRCVDVTSAPTREHAPMTPVMLLCSACGEIVRGVVVGGPRGSPCPCGCAFAYR